MDSPWSAAPALMTGMRLKVSAGLVAAAILFVSEPFALGDSSCVASPELEARVRANPAADTYTNLGDWFAQRQQFDCAAGAFASAYRLQPTSAYAAYLWGLSLSSAGKNEQALAPLEEAVRLEAHDIRPHLALAAVFDRMKKTVEAEAEWHKALSIDPQSVLALDSLSRRMIDQKDYSSVIALLDKPGMEQSRTAVESLNLGMAYAGRVQLDKAARVLREGLHKSGDSLPLANELALVLMLLGRVEEASSVFDLALAKHPDDQSTQILYLHAMVTSKSDRALEYGRKLLAAYPNQWEILYLLGVLESRKGDYEQARVHLEHSVLLHPNYYQSQELLGTVLSGLGDLPSAKQHLDQAVALGDDQPEVEYALAQTLKRLGDTAEAQEKLRIYQQLKKTRSDAVQAAGKSEVGDQAMAEGNPSQAAALYQEAIDLTPTEAILYYKLSQARDKIKDFAGEKTSLERAIQLNPNLAEAQNQMGYLTDRAGDLGKAENYFRAAIRVSPSYVVAWMNLAATLAGEEKWQDARQVLSHVTEIDPNNVQALQLGQALRDAHPDR